MVACKNIVLLAAILLSLALAQAQHARGYIELTKDGYRISNAVTLEAGLDVEGDVLITGNWMSKNYSEQSRLPELGGSYVDECTPQRKGAIRWAYTIFEACDGAAWVPLRHCSRNCGFFLPPLPQVNFRTYLCAAGCCSAKLASTAGNQSAGKRMNQAGCTEVAMQIEFQSFDRATMHASPQSPVEQTIWPERLSEHGFSKTLSLHWDSLQCKSSNSSNTSFDKTMICDELPAPAVRGKVERGQCWVKMPTGCDPTRPLPQTNTSQGWFEDDWPHWPTESENQNAPASWIAAGGACGSRKAEFFNDYCMRNDAQLEFKSVGESLAVQCKRLPLAEGYQAALVRRACQGVQLTDAEKCLEDIGKFRTWGDSDSTQQPEDAMEIQKWKDKQLDYQMRAYNLWGDAPWFPFERDNPKTLDPKTTRVARLPKKSPDTFIPPADWALELHTKEGCDKYNYSWPAFDHLRALYNVSGWASRIPGVEKAYICLSLSLSLSLSLYIYIYIYIYHIYISHISYTYMYVCIYIHIYI